MRKVIRDIIRSKAEKAEREGGKSVTLFSLLPIVFIGPFFTFLAGLLALSLSPIPREGGCCSLSVVCLLYLGINWIWYIRVCRIASVQLISAAGVTFVSLLSLLGVLRPFIEDGLDVHLAPAALLNIGYVAVWIFASYQARKGLQSFLEGPLAKRCLDFEKGIYDQAIASKPGRDFATGRPISDVLGSTMPRTRTWWALAMGALVTPVCALLLVALSGVLSRPRQPELTLYEYALALGAGFLAPRCWLNYLWYRTWERENRKPLLIKYLEDRYRDRQE